MPANLEEESQEFWKAISSALAYHEECGENTDDRLTSKCYVGFWRKKANVHNYIQGHKENPLFWDAFLALQPLASRVSVLFAAVGDLKVFEKFHMAINDRYPPAFRLGMFTTIAIVKGASAYHIDAFDSPDAYCCVIPFGVVGIGGHCNCFARTLKTS